MFFKIMLLKRVFVCLLVVDFNFSCAIIILVMIGPHSLVAKRSNGNAEIQVRFSLGAPLFYMMCIRIRSVIY